MPSTRMKKVLLMVLAACMMLAASFAALFMAQPMKAEAATQVDNS